MRQHEYAAARRTGFLYGKEMGRAVNMLEAEGWYRHNRRPVPIHEVLRAFCDESIKGAAFSGNTLDPDTEARR